jgi:hypothetical protein
LWLDEPLPEKAGTGQVDIMIFIRPSPQELRQKSAAGEASDHDRWGLGCCKDLVKPGSVERFLAECRADKERELAAERSAGEYASYAGTASS